MDKLFVRFANLHVHQMDLKTQQVTKIASLPHQVDMMAAN
jgi:hypothetical protein